MKQQQKEVISLSDPLLEQKIGRAAEGLPFECYNCLVNRVTNKENIVIICDYIASMKAEVNPAISYRKSVIVLLTRVLEFFNNSIKFKDLKRENILSFLDSFRKPEGLDPLHKWIGTYNIFREHLIRFFRWLYHPKGETAGPCKRTLWSDRRAWTDIQSIVRNDERTDTEANRRQCHADADNL